MFVLSGDTRGTVSTATAIAVTGPETGSRFGHAVHAGIDMDGDDIDDLVVGAPEDDARGSAWFFHGPVTAGLAASHADVEITCSQRHDLGAAVHLSPDLTGDDRPDLVVVDANHVAMGTVYVLPDLAEEAALDLAVALSATSFRDLADPSVARAGDVDGDGFSDLLVGGPEADTTSASPAGKAWLLYGPITTSSDLDSSAVVLSGEEWFDFFGASVLGPGDLDGDGLNDIAVGATGDDSGELGGGTVFVWRHAPLTSNGSSSADFLLVGRKNRQVGASLAGSSDLAGGTLLVGAKEDPSGIGAGSAFVYSGPWTGTIGIETRGAMVSSDQADLALGTAVAATGDLDGDGAGEYLLGAPGYAGTGSGAGAVFLMPGGGW